MKVLVFVDHDIICRHFLMNGALRPLVQAADVRFVFPDDGGRRLKVEPAELPLGAPFERLTVHPERLRSWRWLFCAEQLQFRFGGHWRALRKHFRKSLGWKAALLLTIAGSPVFRPLLRAVVNRRLKQWPLCELTELLDREKPDLVLHPTVLEGPFINDLLVECRARKIPVLFVMNSWDNPSTKRAVVGKPDWLLVWGPQTRNHAIQFLRMDPSRVVSFGAAQFDAFRDAPRLDRPEFCKVHGLEEGRRILLFAGSNTQTDELATLQALNAAVEDGRLSNVSIVYRPHPWGGGGRGGARLASLKLRHVAVDSKMRAYLDHIAAGGQHMSLPDYHDTHDILNAVDMVVSPMSTILLEAALHSKPVIAYTPTGADSSVYLRNNIPMLHFADFLKLPEVSRAATADELIAGVAILADPAEGEARGRKFHDVASHFVASFDRPWRERFVAFVQQTMAGRGRGA
jgi:hypothetical protein